MEIKRHYRPTKVKKYEARWYVEGRLKCRFFATEAEREQFIEEFQEQLSENGSSLLLGFDSAKMRRWQEASRLAPDADPVEGHGGQGAKMGLHRPQERGARGGHRLALGLLHLHLEDGR